MYTNEIPPQTLIDLFDKVENELWYVLEDMRLFGDDRTFSKVEKLLCEIGSAKGICRRRNEELKNANNKVGQ